MKDRERKTWLAGAGLVLAFILWTVLIRRVDVRPVGPALSHTEPADSGD